MPTSLVWELSRQVFMCECKNTKGPPPMIGLIVALLSVLLPLGHLVLNRLPRTRVRVIHLLLLYALGLDVGVIGLLFGFIPHVFFADQTGRGS